jgi:hypothetical protein
MRISARARVDRLRRCWAIEPGFDTRPASWLQEHAFPPRWKWRLFRSMSERKIATSLYSRNSTAAMLGRSEGGPTSRDRDSLVGDSTIVVNSRALAGDSFSSIFAIHLRDALDGGMIASFFGLKALACGSLSVPVLERYNLVVSLSMLGSFSCTLSRCGAFHSPLSTLYRNVGRVGFQVFSQAMNLHQWHSNKRERNFKNHPQTRRKR